VVRGLGLRSFDSGAEAVMECLNTSEAGNLLRKSPSAVRNLVMRKAIPYRKVAGRLVFIREELEEWVRMSPGMSLDELKSSNQKEGLL
jgi:hypothetical protein